MPWQARVYVRTMNAQLDSTRAWLVVAATFLASAVTLGTVYSFGSFFESMAADFGTGKGETAIVFGITTFSFFWLSLITGRLVDRFGPRPVMLLGAVSYFVGLMVTSTVDSIGIGYLTYGAGAGLAAACAYIPMLATVGGWFERQRATAIGISVAGIGVGTLVMNPLVTRLLDSYSWRTTFRILGVGRRAPSDSVCCARWPCTRRSRCSSISIWLKRLGHQCFDGCGLRPCLPAWRYSCRSCSWCLMRRMKASPHRQLHGWSPCLVVPACSHALDSAPSPNVSERSGLFRFGVLLFPVSYVIWLVAGSSYALLMLFVIVLGAGYGCFVAVSPLVLANRYGIVGLGSLMGLFYTSQGLGGLIGPPVAGRIIDSTGSYRTPMVLALIAGAVSTAILFSIGTNADGNLEPEPS